MSVSRLQIVIRGLTNRCPNCGGRTLFVPGKPFTVSPKCLRCGMVIEREGDEGFFIGSMSLNYGVTLVCYLTPLAILAYKDVISSTVAIVMAGVGAIGVPFLLYRSSRSWWLMNYYIFLPHQLPANKDSSELQ